MVQEFEKAGELRDKEMELKAKIEAIVSDKKAVDKAEVESAGEDGPVVTEADIANIVAQWTGIPVEKVSSDETGAPSTPTSLLGFCVCVSVFVFCVLVSVPLLVTGLNADSPTAYVEACTSDAVSDRGSSRPLLQARALPVQHEMRTEHGLIRAVETIARASLIGR